MPNRFDVIPREYWQINTIGPAPASLSTDLAALETKVANISTGAVSGSITPAALQTSLGLGAGGGSTTQVTTRALTGMSATWEVADDTVPYALGIRWTAGSAGSVPSIRAYLVSRVYDGATLTAALYDDSGAELRTGTLKVTSSMPVGWVDIPLASPVTVTKGGVYRAAVQFPLASDSKTHFAKLYAGWENYSSTGAIAASSAGGNGWLGYNATTIKFPDLGDQSKNMFGVDVNLSSTVASSNTGARMPVVAYFDDSNAASIARPTSDPLACVLWFNVSGTAKPANALAGVDKVWTA